MADTHLLLSFARIATGALAGTIGILAARAYLRTRRRNVLGLALGAGLLAAGYFAEGVLVEIVGWSIHEATVVESVSTLAAAAILVASLYVKDERAARLPVVKPVGDTP